MPTPLLLSTTMLALTSIMTTRTPVVKVRLSPTLVASPTLLRAHSTSTLLQATVEEEREEEQVFGPASQGECLRWLGRSDGLERGASLSETRTPSLFPPSPIGSRSG